MPVYSSIVSPALTACSTGMHTSPAMQGRPLETSAQRGWAKLISLPIALRPHTQAAGTLSLPLAYPDMRGSTLYTSETRACA